MSVRRCLSCAWLVAVTAVLSLASASPSLAAKKNTRAAGRDGSAIAASWWRRYGLTANAARAGADPDKDGLTNAAEYRLKTNPRRRDTDGDGLPDGYEVKVSHTDPRRADTDGDGLSDGYEVKVSHTDPRRADPPAPAISSPLTSSPIAVPDPSRLSPPNPKPPVTSNPDVPVTPPNPPVTPPNPPVTPPNPPVTPPNPPVTPPNPLDSDGDGVLDSDEVLIGSDPLQPNGATRVVYVSPSGSDTDPGTAAKPVATLGKAFGLVNGGGAIYMLPGTYPSTSISRAYSSDVLIQGVPRDGQKPVIAGPSISGASHLVFRGLHFTGNVQVWSHPVLKASQVAHDITFENNEFTGGGPCLSIVEGSYNIAVRGNDIHDASTGITGSPSFAQSHDITIENNRLAHFKVDAMMFGYWDNVTIANNEMYDATDPAGVAHNDLIQFIGRSTGVTIRANILHDSSQEIFLKPDYGPIDDVTIVNNLVYDARGNAVQAIGSTRVRIINNTVWHPGNNAIYIRGTAPWTPTHDAIVVNNVTDGVAVVEGAQIARFANNVTPAPITSVTLPGLIVNQDNRVGNPLFTAPQSGDYSPGPSSPALGAADPAYAPATDLFGRPRSSTQPSAGAVE